MEHSEFREPASSGARAADTELAPGHGISRTLAVGYDCNNTCAMCLVEPQRGSKPAMAWDTYRRLVDAAAANESVDRLILSGAEPSLDRDLLRRAEYARDSGGFRHVRVQSNGRRFSDAKFARAARDAGSDEFYISVRAHNAEVDASITGRKNNFPEMLAGLENIRAVGGTLLTCTPVFERNVQQLTEIVELVLGFEPARIEFYNFVPVCIDQYDLLAPLSSIQPALLRALDRVASSPAEAAATWFPRCILGRQDHAFVPDLPETTIDDEFWRSFPLFHCFYKQTCAWYGPCQGLTEPYIERFGWEVERLCPHKYSPIAEEATAFNSSAPNEESLDLRAELLDRLGDLRWLQLLSDPDGNPLVHTSLWSVETVTRYGRQVRYRLLLPSGDRYELVLKPRNDAGRFPAQTTGFNVGLLPIGSSSRRFVHRLLFTLLPILSRNDDGRLRLD